MNLLLHGLRDARIEKGDTIRNPRLLDPEGNLILYDRVIANPPFSLDAWGADDVSGENEKKSFNRFIYGIPPKNMGDLAFVQHMVATLNAKGVCGVVMPHGVLFRGPARAHSRGDAKGGFVRGYHWPAGEPVRRHGHFRGHAHPQQGQSRSPARARFCSFTARKNSRSDQRRISLVRSTSLASSMPSGRGRTKNASAASRLQEIEENDFNLNISRYIDTLEPENPD